MKLKRLFLGAALALTAVLGAQAQSEIICNPDNKAYFGARISIDAAIPGAVKAGHVSEDMFNNGAGFSFGAIYNHPIYYNLYVEPGFSFYYNTMGTNDEYVSEEFQKTSLREFGFKIPVMLGYHFDFDPVRIHVFTGPELRVGLSGKIHSKAQVGNVDMSGSTTMYDSFNRADLAWRLGVGADWNHFNISLSGAVGMCNQLKHADGATMHRNVFNLTLGYNF